MLCSDLSSETVGAILQRRRQFKRWLNHRSLLAPVFHQKSRIGFLKDVYSSFSFAALRDKQDRDGYIVTESSLDMTSFHVMAACGFGTAGRATVSPCKRISASLRYLFL